MKINTQMQLGMMIAVYSLGLFALPGRVSSTTLSGNYTTPQAYTNQVILLSGFTNNAGGTVTDYYSDGLWYNYPIQLSGNNSISGDLTASHDTNFPDLVWGYIFGLSGNNTLQSGGTVHGAFSFNNSGNYTLNSGLLRGGHWFNVASAAGSVLTQNGGTIYADTNVFNSFQTGEAGIDVGGASQTTPVPGQHGTLILSNGVLLTGNFLVGRVNDGSTNANRAVGVVVQEAGSSVTIFSSHGWVNNTIDGHAPFVISQINVGSLGANAAESSYTLKGGTLSVSNGNTKVYQWGKFAGYGAVNTTSARALDNSGKVVANGFGVDRTLDLSQYGSIFDSTDNGVERTGAGWYAINKGKLTLPKLTLAAGNSTNMWGESATDFTPDMVNSLKVKLNNLGTGGNLTISLLAKGRSDVPSSPDGRSFLGIWDFATAGGFSFGGGNADLTFRFDDASDQGADLKLWHYDGGWTLLTSTYNDVDHTISTSGVNSFSLFAITVPEPSSVALLALGGMLLMRRRV